MNRYIIDANLPYYFSLWKDEKYEHIIDIDPNMKDADFSDRIMLNNPPPKVIHIKLGNMKMKAFHDAIDTIWDEVLMMSREYKLVRVFKDKIEGIG